MILVYFAKIIDDTVLAITEAFLRRCDQLVQNNMVLRGMRKVLVACERANPSRRALRATVEVPCYALGPACAGSLQDR